jgi:outer membrane protein
MRFIAASLTLILALNAFAEEKTRTLTLAEARQIAVAKYPRLSAAELTALAARQVVKEARAAALPQIGANLGAVATSESGVRTALSGLSLSGIYDRASASVNVSQLITDFGRTSNLIASSRLKADAETQQVEATRAQLLLEVDAAFYGILEAKALLDVAEQAVKTRTLLRDNTLALQRNQLKSALDVSFSEVNLQDAILLLARTRNDVQSAHATLARLLIDKAETVYDPRPPAPPPPLHAGIESLVQLALRIRPELTRLRLDREAAWKFAEAERALNRPTLSVQAAAGVLPYRDKDLDASYAAGGLVLSWALSSGGLNTARAREAQLRAEAAEQFLKDKEAEVTRDVQLAWLNANNAAERLEITGRLREQAAQSYALAEARYNAGSSSVIELSQAQFNLTSAEITQTTTRYEYLIRRAALDFQIGASVTSAHQANGQADKKGQSADK